MLSRSVARASVRFVLRRRRATSDLRIVERVTVLTALDGAPHPDREKPWCTSHQGLSVQQERPREEEEAYEQECAGLVKAR